MRGLCLTSIVLVALLALAPALHAARGATLSDPTVARRQGPEQTKTGSVTRVDVGGMRVTVLAARELTFTVTDRTQIARDAKPAKLADVQAGSQVTVSYVKDGDTRTATRILLLTRPALPAAQPAGGLAPDSTFTVTFPDMPPTFHALATRQDAKAWMTVYLPRNYDPARRHPLLVCLNGGDGGDGGDLGVARGISGQQDFVCVSMPLFRASGWKVDDARSKGAGYVMSEPDGRAMWPLFRTMLDKVETLVPNIDKSHRVAGGFSNGAHAIAALIDGSDGEFSKLFSAFLVVEGSGKLVHYERLKGKAFMMVSSSSRSKPRALQILEAARAAGARATFLLEDVGKHDFPVSAYPAVKTWLHGQALE